MTAPFSFLLSGHDTVECAYYLAPGHDCKIDFARLSVEKERLRLDKSRTPKLITLGALEFLFHPYGTSSGHSFVIENQDFKIGFSEFMSPSFFVKYKCQALWQKGINQLHNEFMQWVESVGLIAFRSESLSRVDFSFDVQLPELDFDENSFISKARKDSRYRKNQQVQTFQFGKGNIVLRVYDKVAEIEEESHKDWFYELWGTDRQVWRIEWQCRKSYLKRFGLHTVEDLLDGQGDLVHYLANEHDTLRQPNSDSNRSRWPLHPLWSSLQVEIESLSRQGVYREIDADARLEKRRTRIAISVLGYLKQLAAIDCVKQNKSMLGFDETLERLNDKLSKTYEPFTWRVDVEKRINQIRMGQ